MTEAEVMGLLCRDESLMAQLQTVAELDLADCWIAAGAVRNRIWDALHGRASAPDHRSDVDVVHFDALDMGRDRDLALETRLNRRLSGVGWQVRNQARMHSGNGDTAYRDTADAMCHWPETATAVGVRLQDGEMQLLTPLGIDDLTGMIVRPTPAFAHKQQIFTARMAAKNWRARWPRLVFVEQVSASVMR